MSFKLTDWLRYEIRQKCQRLQDKWERSAAKKWINDNPNIIIAITCVSLSVLLVVFVWFVWPEKTVKRVEHEKEWFYDLNTGELFAAEKGLTPPIDAPSGPLLESSGPLRNGGPAGVRACVLAYISEPNESERFIGFLETTDPRIESNSLPALDADASGAEQWGHGKLIRQIEDERWVGANSRWGQAILEEAYRPNENGETPIYCQPK